MLQPHAQNHVSEAWKNGRASPPAAHAPVVISFCSEVFDDGRTGARNIVERDEPGGKVRTGVQGYMLFRKDLVPETSFELNGQRAHVNGYRTEVSCSE